MPAGTLETALLCRPGFAESPHIPCPAGTGAVAVQVYAITPASAEYIDGVIEPVNYDQAGAVWGFFFTTTLLIYLAAWSLGAVARPLLDRFRH